MADENTELLREIAASLKYQIEERRKLIGDAADRTRVHDDFKRHQEELERRMQVNREKGEQRRQEVRTYQESVLSELRKISSLLEQMQKRSGGAE